VSVYSVWNNKGGVGKSYLTFQVASEYASVNPDKRVLVIDVCPQANSSSMLLGGIEAGEATLNGIHQVSPRMTISGYMEDRILSPYVNPKTGARYATQVSSYNPQIPDNLWLVVGDDQLEIRSSRVTAATFPGPQDSWRIVHTWLSDLISDVAVSWDQRPYTVFLGLSEFLCTKRFESYPRRARKLLA
jgi:chromosome partitioning protein